MIRTLVRITISVSIALVLLVSIGFTGSDDQHCMREAMSRSEMEGGLAIYSVGKGETHFVRQEFWDFRDERTTLPMASLTKPVVAHQIRRGIESGLWSLDSTLGSTLPKMELTPRTKSVTLRQLLQHQAGFRRIGYDPLFLTGNPDCSYAVTFGARYGPEVDPLTLINYSNEGYCFLGAVLLTHPAGISEELADTLSSPLGGAGGWVSSLGSAYQVLLEGMPILDMPTDVTLPDGSYYAYAWRHWPAVGAEPRWTHFGRLPGMMSIAASDGFGRLLVAHFKIDPVNAGEASRRAVEELWQCMPTYEARKA